MNPESMAMRSIDRSRESRTELSPTMLRAFEKADAEILHNPDYCIQETDFADVYGAEVVASEVAFAHRLEREFASRQTSQEANTKKIADTFEAIVLMQAEMSEWLGQANTLKTAQFDDYKNKVDMIAEWSNPAEGSRVLALAVDATFGFKTSEKKFDDIKKEIDSDKLGSIRYFKDANNDFMGTRNNVPRVVIGVSQPVVEELAGLWLNKENKKLAAHPMQRLLVDEVGSQLHMMHEYARSSNKPIAAQAYAYALSVIRPLRQEKSHIALGGLADDPVAKEIFSQSKAHFLR